MGERVRITCAAGTFAFKRDDAQLFTQRVWHSARGEQLEVTLLRSCEESAEGDSITAPPCSTATRATSLGVTAAAIAEATSCIAKSREGRTAEVYVKRPGRILALGR